MKKTIQVEIVAPDVPNFLRNVVKGREKAILVPIEDLTDDELGQIGAEWTRDLLKKAQKKRKKSL